MSPEEQAKVIGVLCSQALADNLGDVRDAETSLWDLLGAAPLPSDHPAANSNSAFEITKARLEAAGLALPAHLVGADDGSWSEGEAGGGSW